MPWTDYIWRKNPVVLRLFPNFRMTPIVPFSISQIKEREYKDGKNKSHADQDILSSFIKARAEDPSIPEW